MNKYIFTLLLLIPNYLSAQVKEAGLWSSVSVSKEIFKDIEINLSPELRLENNLNTSSSFLDSGIEYKFKKWFSPALHYRVILKNDGQDLSVRHRYFVDLNFALPERLFTLKYRARIQQQWKDVNSSDDGTTPGTVYRNKFEIEYDHTRRISSGASYEFWLPLHNDNLFVDHKRVGAGLNYTLTRKSRLSFNYIIDIDREGKTPVNTFITSIGYKYKLDK